MRVYRTTRGIVIQVKGQFYLSKHTSWESFVSRKDLFFSISREIQFLQSDPGFWDYVRHFSLPPIGQQEVWQLDPTPQLLSTASRCVQNESTLSWHGHHFRAGIAVLMSAEARFQGITLFHQSVHPQAYPTRDNCALGPCLWIPEPDVDLAWDLSTQIIRNNQIISKITMMLDWRAPKTLNAFWGQQSFPEGMYLSKTYDLPIHLVPGDRVKTILPSLGDLRTSLTT